MNREEMRLAAEEMDTLKDSGHELDGLVRVKAKVAKNPREVIVFELDTTAFLELLEAANAVGLEVDDFVRGAISMRVNSVSLRDLNSNSKPAPPRRKSPARKASA